MLRWDPCFSGGGAQIDVPCISYFLCVYVLCLKIISLSLDISHQVCTCHKTSPKYCVYIYACLYILYTTVSVKVDGTWLDHVPGTQSYMTHICLLGRLDRSNGKSRHQRVGQWGSNQSVPISKWWCFFLQVGNLIPKWPNKSVCQLLVKHICTFTHITGFQIVFFNMSALLIFNFTYMYVRIMFKKQKPSMTSCPLRMVSSELFFFDQRGQSFFVVDNPFEPGKDVANIEAMLPPSQQVWWKNLCGSGREGTWKPCSFDSSLVLISETNLQIDFCQAARMGRISQQPFQKYCCRTKASDLKRGDSRVLPDRKWWDQRWSDQGVITLIYSIFKQVKKNQLLTIY